MYINLKEIIEKLQFNVLQWYELDTYTYKYQNYLK